MSRYEFYSLHQIRASEQVARQCINKLLGLPRTDVIFDRVPLETYQKRMEMLAASYLRLEREEDKLRFQQMGPLALDKWLEKLEDVYESISDYGTERFAIWMINSSVLLVLECLLPELKTNHMESENAHKETHGER